MPNLEHGPDPGIGEDRVERGGEVRAAVADHEPDSVRLLTEVHDLAVPAQDRVRSDQQPQPVAVGFGITLSRVAGRARSARFSFGGRTAGRATLLLRAMVEILGALTLSPRNRNLTSGRDALVFSGGDPPGR